MRTSVIAVGVLAVAGFASAQRTGPLPPLTAQVEVHVVNVDVSITDSSGKPVLGLSKDDFEIFEDGKPQKITNFSAIQNELGAGPPSSAATAQQRTTPEPRHILLIIDNNYLGVVERNQALDTVQKYIDGSFSGEWAVATIGHTAAMVQPFTADKALIRSALAKVRAMPSSEIQHKIDRSILSERFIRRTDFAEPENYRAQVAFSSREQTYRNLLTVQNTARAVVDTARAYAADEGKKSIILLTGGMELNTTFTAFEDPNDFELKELRDEIAKVSDAMVREANGANFTVYVINARASGMMAPQHDVANHSSGMNSATLLRSAGNDPIDVSDVDSIPLSIALGTGGMYLPSSDLHGSLQKIDAQTGNFYSLGYSPDHNGDHEYHTISVRVKRSGVHVASRVGYFDETPEDQLEDMLRLRTDPGFGSLPLRVEIGGAAPAEADLVVPVTAVLPLARITVVPQGQDFVGRIHVYCSVFDAAGNNVGFVHQTQEVTMSPALQSGGGDYRYTIKVHLRKGAFTVVITVRDELSSEIGSASETVHL